ncbi:MAG TPA: type VI secretion system protein TssA [Blastocatellia bacterium]|nr:type VI secretion system protein TssA [Blastocatellia bacterium]
MSSAAVTATAPAAIVDVDALLAPIAGQSPAGESLQYSGLHDEIREARRADDDLAQGDWKRELKAADWHQVKSLATDALANRTKDLQVCAWLAEALVKLHGLAGLRDGLHLMRGLHERFWDNLYPEIDEGDLEARANSLAWMDRQLAIAIKDVVITKSAAGVDRTFLDWQASKDFDIAENAELSGADLERAEALRARAQEEGKVTGEEWRKAKNATRRAFYEETWAAVSQCWDEFRALERVVDEKFDRQAPSLSDLKKSLDEFRTLIDKVVKEKRLLEPDPSDALSSGEAGDGQATGGAVPGAATGPIQTRQDALRRLAEVAQYFRATEPHSPVSYLVQRAIKWGEMPLETWLQDVIKDDGVLSNLRETLGMKGGSDGGGNREW